jgi:hypothetical protein
MENKRSLLLSLFTLIFCSFSFSQASEEWDASHSNKSTTVNDAVIAVDASGYIYVAGTKSGTNTDWFVIKYLPDSTESWTYTYNGTGSGNDYVTAITVSDSGFIFVTGSGASSSNGNDMVTIKLDNSGNMKWTKIYDGSAHLNDVGRALITDASGNIYVTGDTEDSHSLKDVVTIKYTPAGAVSWTNVYANSGTKNDAPAAITLDASGNVIVAGYKQNSSSVKDALVIKYTSGGTQSWVFTLDGGGSADDNAADVVTDASSNIYFTGATYKSSKLDDYFTVKLNSSGAKQWSATYNGAINGYDVATDIVYSNSNIYVTGRSQGTTSSVTTYDYATLKYNTSGTVQWTVRYNGSANGADEASHIVADYNGDLIITGSSDGGTSARDYFTMCMDASGAELWSVRNALNYNGNDYATGLVADAYGNAYVTGTGQSGSSTYDFMTVKYADKVKNAGIIQIKLQNLAAGFLDVAGVSTVRNYLYNNIDSGYYDSIPKHCYKTVLDLFSIAQNNSYYLRDTVNKTLNKINSTSNIDYVTPILNTLWWEGHIMTPLITVPYFRTFNSTSLNQRPNIGYITPLEENYPVAGYTGFQAGTSIPAVDSFDKTDAQGMPLMLFSTMLAPPCYIDGPTCMDDLVQCLWENSYCSACNSTFPVDGIPVSTNAYFPLETSSYPIGCDGINFQNNEVKLMITYDGCFDGITYNTSSFDNYSKIETVSGFDYWFVRNGSGDYKYAMKTPWPIISYYYHSNGYNHKAGRSLTLCSTCNSFNKMSKYLELNDYPYGTAQGLVTGALGESGLFKLSRPHQKPLYIITPMTTHMWYEGSPDGGYYFGTTCVCNPCSTCTCATNIQKIQEDYMTGDNNGFANNTWGYDNDKLASTDYTTIRNFWLANKIVVGFSANQLVQSANSLTFTQGFTTAQCSTVYTSATLIRELTLTSNPQYSSGAYGVQNSLSNIPPNTVLHVQVDVNFKNGQSISGYQDVTISGSQNMTIVVVDIQGQVKDYSSSVDNYHIRIYQ